MKTFLSITALALVSVGLGMADDTLITTGTWYANAGPTGVGTSGYWDNASSDGKDCNIGYILDGTAPGTCGSKVPGSDTIPLVKNVPFLAGATAGTAANFQFSGNSTTTSFVVSYAGYTSGSPGETFGYTDTTGSHNLFTVAGGVVTSGSGLTFTPVGTFDFFTIIGSGSTPTYTTGVNGNQFALFDPGATLGPAINTGLKNYWIGSEDQAVSGGDRDYNDLVVHVQSLVATPEPSFYGLLALAFCGIGFAVRRRQARQQ